VSEPLERSVRVGGRRCRVWEKGRGEPLGFLGGLRGLPRWTPFLERLAERRRVVAPSLPGFPGGPGCEGLDDLPDWIATTLDLLEASGLEGADLVGASVGGMLAAEVAAFSNATLRRLVLISPFGLADEREPEELALALESASEAARRLVHPPGRLGLARRLHRVRTPTLLVWGSGDRVVPPSHAKRFASALAGWVELRQIDGAGHGAEIDAPDAVADAVLGFLSARG